MGNLKKKIAAQVGGVKARQARHEREQPPDPKAKVVPLMPGKLGSVTSSGDKSLDDELNRLLAAPPEKVEDPVLAYLLKQWQPAAILFGGSQGQVERLQRQLDLARREATKAHGGVSAVEKMLFDRLREKQSAGAIRCEGCGETSETLHVTGQGAKLCPACYEKQGAAQQ